MHYDSSLSGNAETRNKVGQVILVAGFHEDLGPDYTEIRSFIDMPVDWEKVRSHCSQFSVIHSDDDTAVPVHFAQSLADNLQTPFELHHGYKHFGADDNVMELPLVLKKIV